MEEYVYIVKEYSGYDDDCSVDVLAYTSEIKAQAYVDRMNKRNSKYRYSRYYYEIEKIALDLFSTKCFKNIWLARICKADGILIIERKGNSREEEWEEEQIFRVENKNKYIWVHSSISLDHAKQLAIETLNSI